MEILPYPEMGFIPNAGNGKFFSSGTNLFQICAGNSYSFRMGRRTAMAK